MTLYFQVYHFYFEMFCLSCPVGVRKGKLFENAKSKIVKNFELQGDFQTKEAILFRFCQGQLLCRYISPPYISQVFEVCTTVDILCGFR